MKQELLVHVTCPSCGEDRTRHERIVRGYDLVRCRCCGFVYANPQAPAEYLLSDYEARGNAHGLINFYERVTTPERLTEYERILADMEATLPGRGRLLDFGCGPGYFVERAAHRGWEAHGVEPGTWAEQAAARLGLQHFHRGLLADQRFADGYFHVVCANQVLEHLAAPRSDLGEIRRILRPGGLFYANVPNYRTLPILLGCDDFELNCPMAHLNYFTPSTLTGLLRRCGFEELWTSTSGGLKWENLIGRRTMSEESRAHRGEPPSESRKGVVTSAASPRRPSLVKRLLRPFVKGLFYKWAQVGMTLEICARKP
jgi:SAM-dependent methyltransferase